jgi:hypothetical protein
MNMPVIDSVSSQVSDCYIPPFLNVLTLGIQSVYSISCNRKEENSDVDQTRI